MGHAQTDFVDARGPRKSFDFPLVSKGTPIKRSVARRWTPPPAKYVADRVLVLFRNQSGALTRNNDRSRLGRFGLTLDAKETSPYFDRFTITPAAKAAGMTVEKAVTELRKDPTVEIAEPDYIVQAFQTPPNDTYFAKQWGLSNSIVGGSDVHAVNAWNVTKGSSSVKVAVIDTGVDTAHPDLSGNILKDSSNKVVGIDFYNGDADPMDDNGHGTHCAGVIAATQGNGAGISGVAPGVKIMPIKIFGAAGNGPISNGIKAIDWARTNGASVMSCSWGSYQGSMLLLKAIQRAEAAGIPIAAAAGNDSVNVDEYPSYPSGFNVYASNVISVAATNVGDSLAWFSNYGSSVDIAAPGDSILSTLPGKKYGLMSGTSMATPHVAGVLALIRSKFTTANLAEIRSRLLRGDRPLFLDGDVANGRVDAVNALETDTKAPGTPSSLKPIAKSASAVRYKFTASGDDGSTGAVDRYEVRFSYSPITTTNFASAQLAHVITLPAASGATSQFVLKDLLPGKTVYCAIRAIDNVGNPGPVAIASNAATLAADWSDDMEGATSKWTATGAWAVKSTTAYSGSKSWASSPSGYYPPNSGSAMTMASSFTTTGPTFVHFNLKTDIQVDPIPDGEPGGPADSDMLRIDYSVDGGTKWFVLGSVVGTNDWQSYTQALPTAAGAKLKIRFVLLTNQTGSGQGAWVDDVRLVKGNIALVDNAETASKMVTSSPWKQTTSLAYSPTHSWTNSTGSSYADSMNAAITSANNVDATKMMPLYGIVTFNGAIDGNGDFMFIESSQDSKKSWLLQDILYGSTGGTWTQIFGDLTECAGASFAYRFRFYSNGDGTVAKGAFVDDTLIVGEPCQAISG